MEQTEIPQQKRGPPARFLIVSARAGLKYRAYIVQKLLSMFLKISSTDAFRVV